MGLAAKQARALEVVRLLKKLQRADRDAAKLRDALREKLIAMKTIEEAEDVQ